MQRAQRYSLDLKKYNMTRISNYPKEKLRNGQQSWKDVLSYNKEMKIKATIYHISRLAKVENIKDLYWEGNRKSGTYELLMKISINMPLLETILTGTQAGRQGRREVKKRERKENVFSLISYIG